MPPVACFAVLRRLRIPLLLQGCVPRVPYSWANPTAMSLPWELPTNLPITEWYTIPGIETVFREDRVVEQPRSPEALVGLFISEAIPVAQYVSRQPFVGLRE